MVSPKIYLHSKGWVVSVRPEAFSQLRSCFPSVAVSKTPDHVSLGLSSVGTFVVAVTTPLYPDHGFGRAIFKLPSTATLSTTLITVPAVSPLVFLIPAPRHTISSPNKNQDFTPDSSPDMRTPAAPPSSTVLSKALSTVIPGSLTCPSSPRSIVAPGFIPSVMFHFVPLFTP